MLYNMSDWTSSFLFMFLLLSFLLYFGLLFTFMTLVNYIVLPAIVNFKSFMEILNTWWSMASMFCCFNNSFIINITNRCPILFIWVCLCISIGSFISCIVIIIWFPIFRPWVWLSDDIPDWFPNNIGFSGSPMWDWFNKPHSG